MHTCIKYSYRSLILQWDSDSYLCLFKLYDVNLPEVSLYEMLFINTLFFWFVTADIFSLIESHHCILKKKVRKSVNCDPSALSLQARFLLSGSGPDGRRADKLDPVPQRRPHLCDPPQDGRRRGHRDLWRGLRVFPEPLRSQSEPELSDRDEPRLVGSSWDPQGPQPLWEPDPGSEWVHVPGAG